MSSHQRGAAAILASACGFGAAAIFAKQAYAAGFGVTTMLTIRFVLAAAVFWAIVAVRRPARPDRGTVLGGLGLGAAGYAAQAGLFFGSVARIEASLAALLLSAYPVLVVAGAVVIGRERATRTRMAALGLAVAGTVLVLTAGDLGAVDGLGAAMAFGAGVVYATYILVADRAGGRDPILLAALVMTGAAASTSAYGLLAGTLDFGAGPEAWAWTACVALVSTVLSVGMFFIGLPLVGPSAASIISTAEPVVTVSLAMLVLGEALGPLQLAGGALVLAAIVVLASRAGTVAVDGPPDHLAPPAAARAVAS